METIDKIAWLYIKSRKALFLRSKGKDVFYHPGGKREGKETDKEALIREIHEELSIDLKPETIEYVTTFSAQAHGKPEGTIVKITYYNADYSGECIPSGEIEELAWFTSKDADKVSATGQMLLQRLKKQDLID